MLSVILFLCLKVLAYFLMVMVEEDVSYIEF